jgi:hypothetical protein
MDPHALSDLGNPSLVREGRMSHRAALIGAVVGAVVLLVALLVTVAPAGGSAAYLGPLLAKGGHKHHSHHHSGGGDSDSGDSDSSGDGGGMHSQSLSSDGSTQHNTGCSKVIHSLGGLDGAIQDANGSNGAICVQMNNQSVDNPVGNVDESDGSSDWSDSDDNSADDNSDSDWDY